MKTTYQTKYAVVVPSIQLLIYPVRIAGGWEYQDIPIDLLKNYVSKSVYEDYVGACDGIDKYFFDEVEDARAVSDEYNESINHTGDMGGDSEVVSVQLNFDQIVRVRMKIKDH
jgi:hypothetical protein